MSHALRLKIHDCADPSWLSSQEGPSSSQRPASGLREQRGKSYLQGFVELGSVKALCNRGQFYRNTILAGAAKINSSSSLTPRWGASLNLYVFPSLQYTHFAV